MVGQLETARGAYQMANDNYLKLVHGNRPQEVAIAKFQEHRAKDIVRQAQQNIIRLKSQIESLTQQAIRDDSMADRQRYLDEQGVISDQDRLNAETQSKMTHAQLEAARRELGQAEGTLARDIGTLEQAKMDLERYRQAWARNAIPKQQLDDLEKIVVPDEGLMKADQGKLDFDV